MIIVTSPWQFAFCPSRRSSCSPSAILRSMPYFRQSQGQNLQRRRFPKTKTTCRPGKKLKRKKKKEGECPKGENDFAEQKAGGKQLSGQMRVVFEELFIRGSGAWRHHDVSAGCSFPPPEPALFWGHRAAVGFYFQTSVLQPCEYISCY